MTPEHIAAFSNGAAGGNPAGVVIEDQMPPPEAMQALAKELGYSESVFAAPEGDGWRVRYFSPAREVDFCGHATIALGAALGRRFGAASYALNISNAQISVAARQEGEGWAAELTSPKTWSKPLPEDLLAELKALFGLTDAQIDPQLPPTLAFAGEQHAVIALKNRDDLAAMAYDFDTGKALMERYRLITVTLLFIENEAEFISRNAFAFGGVVEDPATGAAAAALGGALVDLDWPSVAGGGTFLIRQGEDMGQPSRLQVTVTGVAGEPVRVGGAARNM